MTRQAAVGDWSALRHTFSRGLRSIFFITIPSAVGLLALGEPIVRLLFQAGAFGAEDTAATAYALLFYAPGLVALSGIQLLTRIYYSLQDTRTPVKVGIQGVIINTVLSLVFLKFTNLESGGLALAYSITNIANMTSYVIRLRRKMGAIDGRRILTCLAKAAAAASVMGIVVYELTGLIGTYINLAALTGRTLQVVVPMGVGALLYLFLTWLLRMEELSFVREMCKGRRR